MSQTQRDDLTAGAGDGARPGLITDVLGSEGGEGCWESMRLLRAALFGLEVATLSPQQGGPVPSVPPPPGCGWGAPMSAPRSCTSKHPCDSAAHGITAWGPAANGGTPGLPISAARGVGMAVPPQHLPSLISISGQAGPGRGGGGMMAEKHSAFPLIAKINTLKFLQEAEECGTAGKNCFIICNNTKARGGGREGGGERRAVRGEGRLRQRVGRGREGCFLVTVTRRMGSFGSQCRGGVLGLHAAMAPCTGLSSTVPQFPFLNGVSSAPDPHRGQFTPCLTRQWGRDKASRCVPGTHLLSGWAPPFQDEIKGIFLPLGNQIKASHLPRSPFAVQMKAAGSSGRGTKGVFNTAADELRVTAAQCQPQQGRPLPGSCLSMRPP